MNLFESYNDTDFVSVILQRESIGSIVNDKAAKYKAFDSIYCMQIMQPLGTKLSFYLKS